jgi:hypothetical protein
MEQEQNGSIVEVSESAKQWTAPKLTVLGIENAEGTGNPGAPDAPFAS